MFAIVTATAMVVGPAVNWLLAENEKLDAEDKALGKLQEASWWMGACQKPQDHIPEIRRITRLQPSRWS